MSLMREEVESFVLHTSYTSAGQLRGSCSCATTRACNTIPIPFIKSPRDFIVTLLRSLSKAGGALICSFELSKTFNIV